MSVKIDYFLVDPMSYDNLEQYDKNLLQEFNNDELLFLCSTKISETPLNVKTKKIYSYNDKKSVMKLFSYLLSQFHLISLVFLEKPKSIHFQWFKIPVIDFYLLKSIKLISKNTKIIFTAHNMLPHDTGNTYYKKYRDIYNFIDVIIVHDLYTQKQINHKFGISIDKIKVVRHGLLNINVDKQKVNEFYIKNKVDNKIVFSLLGSLENYKGINLIYEVWNTIEAINSSKNIKLIIAGRGKSDVIKKFKKFDNVLVVDRYLSNEEFIGFMKVSDVVLMPYEKISQSGVLLTAINERKLSIVSNVGGLTEPFALAKIGWVMSDYSKMELGKIIEEASRLLKKKIYITDEDYNRLNEYYDWKNISNQTKNIYNGL